MTRTFSFAKPIACAIACWFGNGVCVEIQTVIVPFSSRASAVCVSIGGVGPVPVHVLPLEERGGRLLAFGEASLLLVLLARARDREEMVEDGPVVEGGLRERPSRT